MIYLIILSMGLWLIGLALVWYVFKRRERKQTDWLEKYYKDEFPEKTKQ